MEQPPVEIPERIQQRLIALQEEARSIIAEANCIVVRPPYKGFSFRYESSAPRDLLTEDERAQSVCFVTRYEALPTVVKLTIKEAKGSFHLANLGDLRHALNEFRPVIMNQKDSLYFGNIHKFCRQKLTNNDPTNDMMITVMNESDLNVTTEFVKFLDQQTKAIRKVISSFDFAYIYNGILQHSDHSYTKQYLDDYASGELNYVFFKHNVPLTYIKDCLHWHYRLINMLTFPTLGPL